ncbi:MAG: cytochrome c-type biogenesis protein CcmH [Gammaproteobacteria bacterium]|nr:cytochrome c-type biogenesis protein CcmH [Gammaproteobacteria bacterium]
MFVLKHSLTLLLLGTVVAVSIGTQTVLAKEAEHMAEDPVMEKLVNEISQELRCLVCQNQTIADSNAELAVDLKNQVRDMVKAGRTQDDIVDYMVERYGDFVRYRPPVKPSTYVLWVGPFILLIVGITLLVRNLGQRKQSIIDAPLSDRESQDLKSILTSNPISSKVKNEAEGSKT